MPGLLLGDEAPNFEADTTQGRIRFHDFLGDSWGILFSHPRDFTPVCTTELGRAAKLAPEFSKRNVKMIALSIDSVQDHLSWCKDINAYNGEQPAEKLPFPIIADKNRELAVKLGMLDPDELDKDGMPLTARVVFVFGPDKKLKLSILYPATTGRNFDEILRVVDSLQLTAYKKVATPVDWKNTWFGLFSVVTFIHPGSSRPPRELGTANPAGEAPGGRGNAHKDNPHTKPSEVHQIQPSGEREWKPGRSLER